jgi:hypothetical protein
MQLNILEKIKLPASIVRFEKWLAIFLPIVVLGGELFSDYLYVELRIVMQLVAICFWIFWLYGLTNGHNSRLFMICISTCLKNTVPVELVDFQGERYFSVAEKSDHGNLSACVYFFSNVGRYQLNTDGTVDASYIRFWLPVKQQDRTFHLLRNDLSL